MHEFELINRYFSHHPLNGDDAADITPPNNHRLVTSVDTSVAGKHFRKDAHPDSIGHKSLAVSLSDIAAMGATPTSCLLSLTLPTADEDWITHFAHGFHALAKQYQVSLIGGDTTQGPLSISTVVFGILPSSAPPLQRNGANADDLIVVSGQLGAAAHALHHPTEDQSALDYPTPRIELGIALRELASSCIDISDGLLQDLSHILRASKVGAKLNLDAMPLAGTHKEALTGGDDYELCFTIPKKHEKALAAIAQQLDIPLSIIGCATADKQLIIVDQSGHPQDIDASGFQHF